MKSLKPLQLLFFIAVLAPLQVRSTHIIGGEMFYECLGGNNYRITMKVYRDCYNGVPPLDNPAYFGIFNSSGSLLQNPSVYLITDSLIPITANNPCLIIPPNICVEEGTYQFIVNLPATGGGYTIAYQRCCRNYSIVNIFDPSNTGTTIFSEIPGSGLATCNSSPYFNNYPPTVICVNYPLVFDHSATDPDGDSLVYELCTPYHGADALNPQPFTPTPPPYPNVTYITPYSYLDPLGTVPPMTIDAQTGLLQVTPDAIGQYVVGVCVKEYRNGNLLETHLRDFQFNVTTCTLPAIAALPGIFNHCDGYTVTFPNYSTGATTYHWDFGVPGLTNDTSNNFSPTYYYPDTGVYVVTLIANPGSGCGDTATALVYVYPTLIAGLIANDACMGDPIHFQDNSVATYGYLNSWTWDFGDGNSSSQQNPTHSYSIFGNYVVQLIVTTDLGCVDTVIVNVIVHPTPAAFADPDTTICYLDSVQLQGAGAGNYLWTPNYNLSNNTLATPWAGPDITTTYLLTVTNAWGCFDTASLTITVFDSIAAFAGADVEICPGDIVQLSGTGYLNFNWLPPIWLSATNIANPISQPDSTITYVMTTSVGSCVAEDTLTIFVKPLPYIIASEDQEICYGDSVQIFADGCTVYWWQPGYSLSDDSLANPFAYPAVSTEYLVSGMDSNACPLVVKDSLLVIVHEPIPLITTPDTTIILGTVAHLYSYGGNNYQWYPADWLSDVNIADPFSFPEQDVVYHISALDEHGCKVYDSLEITVVIDPFITFPNAFTPNDDGVNDEFFPIVLGYFTLDVYRIFNRWGEMVFETSDLKQRWDGRHKGVEEEIGTYVYYLAGTSETTGKKYELKGNVVLLR